MDCTSPEGTAEYHATAKLNVIYLDHNATKPIAPEVLEAMVPYLTSEWGNPSSTYAFGSKLKKAVETARAQELPCR